MPSLSFFNSLCMLYNVAPSHYYIDAPEEFSQAAAAAKADGFVSFTLHLSYALVPFLGGFTTAFSIVVSIGSDGYYYALNLSDSLFEVDGSMHPVPYRLYGFSFMPFYGVSEEVTSYRFVFV